MSNGTRIYLASPYSHKDPAIREQRFRTVCAKAAELMTEGYLVFCPIAHSHPISEYGVCDATSHEFWLEQDFAWLDCCKLLYVYMMPGWKESYGVGKEIERAIARGIPIVYLNYKQELEDAASLV